MTTIRKSLTRIQSFENIRNENYLYVDKAALIYRLVMKGKPYFLSRSRHFGKNLLISTLEAYFQGKKELFKGLATGQLEQDWNVYPVLYFSDLNQFNDISLDYDYAAPCGITYVELVDNLTPELGIRGERSGVSLCQILSVCGRVLVHLC